MPQFRTYGYDMCKALLALCLLASLAARAAEEAEPKRTLEQFLAQGLLTPEQAARFPPAEQLGHLRDEKQYEPSYSTAGKRAEDELFFAEYAKQLRKLTPKKNPAAEGARADLIALFTTSSRFLRRIDPGRNDDEDCIPAYAEWVLYATPPDRFNSRPAGNSHDLRAREAAFTTDEVRVFIKSIGFTRFDFGTGSHPKRVIDPWIDRIMGRLRAYESHLNADGKREIRVLLVRFIDRIEEALYDRH